MDKPESHRLDYTPLAGRTTGVSNATNTDILNPILVNHGIVYKADGVTQDFHVWGAPKTKAPWVLDQYDVEITPTGWTYNVSAVEENAGDFAHLDKSFVVNANDTANTSISGAELGDKYTLTLTAYNNYGSAKGSIKITVGADNEAYISTAAGGDHDKTFRKTVLHYAY